MSDLQARTDAVRAKVDFAAVVEGAGTALGKGKKPRGKCPFHGSKSQSFVVNTATGFAHCWGCPWRGDVIRFVMDSYGLSFRDALERLEEENGLNGMSAAPVKTQRRVTRKADRPKVESVDMGRWIWKRTTCRPDAVRTYLCGRGVPAAVLTDERLSDIRFHALAPLFPWDADADGPAPDALKAPAICALVREPIVEDGAVRFVPIGLHVTYLAPSLDAKMARSINGEALEARKMLGRAGGGCVVLGPHAAHGDGRSITIDPDARLFPGEGIETVFSGMALAAAPPAAIGLATLSLNNLQGMPRLWKGGVWPMHDIRPDPDAQFKAVTFPHRGPIVGLIDADMKPLRGQIDRRTRKPMGMPIVEHRGGPIVRRAITTAERAEICAELFVKAWRAAGSRRVTAARPPMGQDFNDVVRGGV